MDVLPRDERVRGGENNKEKAIETVSRTEKQTRQVRKGENDDDDGQKRGDKCGQTKITSWAIKRQKRDIFLLVFSVKKEEGIIVKSLRNFRHTTKRHYIWTE